MTNSAPAKGFQIQIRYLVLPLLVAIVVFVVYLAIYLGAFKPVIIAEKTAGPFVLLSKKHTGPYQKIVAVIEEVEKWAKEQGLDCKLSFGEYLDDPRTTEEARLRSRGGCLLPQQPPMAVPEGFEVELRAEKKYVTAVFEGSPGIGPMKVYPKVFEYFESQRLPREEAVMEVYEVFSAEKMTTTYYFGISTTP